MRLFRILHWQARARYWHRKFEKAEHTISLLRQELTAEMIRNREREDTFASASILGQRQMYGLAPRSGPAVQPAEKSAALDPWLSLSWADEAEFKTQWWPLAQAQGLTEPQARQDFTNELAQRKQLRDEPFGVQ